MKTTKGMQLTAIAGAAPMACPGWAMGETGNPDWAVRFDNTVKGSLIYRTQSANPALVKSFRLLVPNVPATAFPQAWAGRPREEAVEAQQRAMGGRTFWDLKPVVLDVDAPAVRARRVLDQMLAAEAIAT